MTQSLEIINSTDVVQVPSINDADILARLRQAHQISEIAAAAQRDKLIVAMCDRLDITVSDTELQTAGDQFRLQHQLSSAAKTIDWFAQQGITIEDWTAGIRTALLGQKLQEALFGDRVDAHYLQNREQYQRVALSQILLQDFSTATQVFKQLHAEPERFCALALEHSSAKQSQLQGGFVGIRFVAELMREVAEAVADVGAGAILAPIQTQLGFHILKIEKWFPPELTPEVRQFVLDSLFQTWLKAQIVGKTID